MNFIFQKDKIFLASKSPRRKQLLEDSGFKFEVIALELDESFPDSLDPNEVPEYIAIKKAKAVKNTIPDGSIIIAADCIVIHENKILEKPKNKEEAFKMLQSMSNKQHAVISGVCICKASKQISFSSTTLVKFGDLSSEEIEYYIETYMPFDKAGSYGIQEWIGHCKIERIEGSYTNVMGMPMYEIYHSLISLTED